MYSLLTSLLLLMLKTFGAVANVVALVIKTTFSVF